MITGNESVYPSTIAVDEHGNVYRAEHYCTNQGLTIREEFAKAAMQGMLSNHALIETNNWTWIAINAVEMAEELISALNNKK